MKVLEGSYKEKYVFFQASLEKLDFKEVDSLGRMFAPISVSMNGMMIFDVF